MGFIVLRHVLDYCETSLLKSFSLKYNKYSKMNAQNMKSMKMKAFTDFNFD